MSSRGPDRTAGADRPADAGHPVLWRPSPAWMAAAQVTDFRGRAAASTGRHLPDWAALDRWSIEHPNEFWDEVWRFCGVIGDRGDGPALVDGHDMLRARWFPGASLNHAENLLRGAGDATALVFRGEDGARRALTRAELRAETARVAAALAARGVTRGDRVAGYLPNVPETVIAMLATASLGAVWSSCSPDFGLQGVLDRFGQIEPAVLFAADGQVYGGRRHERLDTALELRRRLPTVRELVIVPCLQPGRFDGGPEAVGWEDFAAGHDGAAEPRYTRVPFAHPLFIMYSSGTTGLPKCMVHSVGGTLLQHLKEHRLHADLRPDDRFLYVTTCGWMMWNWLVSGLASEAAVLLYDGAPLHPQTVLWDLVADEGCTHFGTSARYLAACAKHGLAPRRTHDLEALRSVMSTGSPLAAGSFDWVYREVKDDLQLSSISGGTDIISCFALGSPVLPVRRGELQCRGLGMAVEVWDPAGTPLVGEKGELVCTRPFPSQPTGFWNDPGGIRYRAAYFERFPGVWHHGDWAELRPEGGLVIHGRSDTVLNPGGVRIGTAEISRVVEQFPEVLESVVVGQEWGDDERVVLFVRLRDGSALDDALRERIRERLRHQESPRHVPALIVPVADIPRTVSGKISETAVRRVLHGLEVDNREALANPGALDLFRDLPELQEG
ncbi:MAG: acetoacetate--CoA ligase [Candidatus Krumholzibacteriia bacterium]